MYIFPPQQLRMKFGQFVKKSERMISHIYSSFVIQSHVQTSWLI